MNNYEDENKNQVPFIQFRKQYLTNWRSLVAKNPVSVQILFFFIEKMSKNTNAVICSYQTLMELTGFGRTTIAKAIKILKDDNWIDTVKIGNITSYCVNERVGWQLGNNQRHYAIFSAMVIATETEQEKSFKDKLAQNKLKHTPLIDVQNFREIANFDDGFTTDTNQMDIEDQINE